MNEPAIGVNSSVPKMPRGHSFAPDTGDSFPRWTLNKVSIVNYLRMIVF